MAHAIPTKTPGVELEEAPANHAVGQSMPTVALRTVSVVLWHNDKKIHTNALLDDGSTGSFLSSSVAAELGLERSAPNKLTVHETGKAVHSHQRPLCCVSRAWTAPWTRRSQFKPWTKSQLT